MHYFPGWTEKAVMEMTYDKFIMYLNTIPAPPDEDDDKAKDGEEKTAEKPKPKKVGSFNLWDLDTRGK